MRDAQGRLLAMYHGTSGGGFTVFDAYGKGKFGLFGIGNYFTADRNVAESYQNKGRGQNKQVYEVYLNVKNPIDMDAKAEIAQWQTALPDAKEYFDGRNTNEDCFRALKEYCEDEGMVRWEAEEFISEFIQSMGYDGITHLGGGRYGDKSGPRHRVYITFEPEQVKSIDNKNPTTAPDIRYSVDDVENAIEEFMRDEDGQKKSMFRSGWIQANQQLAERVVRNRPQTQTDAFKKWFGNSQAVNVQGDPLLVFHGARARFTTFNTDGKPIWFSPDPMYAVAYAGERRGVEKLLPGSGIYAGSYERMIPAYIRAENPADFGDTNDFFGPNVGRLAQRTGIPARDLQDVWQATGRKERIWETLNTPEMVELLSFHGFDSVKAIEYGSHTWGVFERGQAKSAVANNGNFDRRRGDIRYSTDDDYIPQSAAEYARMQKETPQDRPFPEEYDSVDEYAADLTAKAEAAKAERMRNLTKEEFTGTPALQKLGVKIAGSVGNYSRVEQLIANDRAAKKIRKETRKAERRLNASEAERSFASGIVAGIYIEDDIPDSMDAEKVMELADYYQAESAIDGDRLSQRRADINAVLEEKMEELFRDSDDFKPSKAIVLNYRTPERNMLHIFGDERGGEINAALFDPVAINEAERFRFVNRMLDEVRTFQGGSGKKTKLTKDERAIVQQVIEGRAAAEMVAGMEMRASIENAAQNIKNGKDAGDAATEFGLSSEERKLAARYAQWLQTEEIMRSGKVDAVKVEAAAKKYSELFNLFYDAINDFLVAHGYEPIGFIKGYAPHIQPEKNQSRLSSALQMLGINTDVTRLPSNIAGLTANYRPNKRWNPYFLQGTTDITEFDIASAFESYVDYMSDVLYHTDDIMRVRQAAKYFRKTYAPDEIRENLSWASELRYGSTEQKANFLREQGEIGRTTVLSPTDVNAMMDKYVEKQFSNITKTTKYSDLVTWFDNYANILAGKQSMADRSPESMFGREILNVGNKLIKVFSQANVAGNLSSMLNQTAQIPMIQAELGTRWTMAAIKDIIVGRWIGLEEWSGESDFLTGKKGIDNLVTTPGEMVVTAMFKPLEIMDTFVSTVAVRGKYLKEINAGRSPKEAMKAADHFGKAVMGSRMKGSKPLAFHSKNPIYQMVNIFQIEAFNSWEHIKEDLPRDFRTIEKEQGKGKAARALAGVIVKALLLSFIANRLAEKLYGGTPAPFDLFGLTANFIASGEGLTTNEYLATLIDNAWEQIAGERLFGTDPGKIGDEPFNWGQAWKDLGYNVSNDIPFLRNVAGLLGLGDETLPMPDLYGGVSGLVDSIGKNGVGSWDTGKEMLGLLAEIVPGGRQAYKSVLGAETLIRGGDFSGTGDNEKLKYPTDGDFWSTVQALMFGKYATEASDNYYAAGGSALSPNQTRLWKDLTEAGADPQAVYDAIQRYRDIANDEELSSYDRGVMERELIRGMDLTDDQKLDLYRGLSNADSRVEKFEAIMDTGLSFSQVMDIYNEYARIDADESMKATEQATAFSKWVDQQGFKGSQARTIKEQLRYWSIIPADAGRYEKLTGAGLEAEDAYELTETLNALEPEDGKSSVSDMQKYRVIAASDLGHGEKIAAIGSIMGTAMTTESGAPSQYAKMLDLLDGGISLEEYLDLKDMDAVDGYLKYAAAARGRNYGITPEIYISFKSTLPRYDADGNGSFTQAEVKAAIDAMSGGSEGLSLPSPDGETVILTTAQKAVLWQIYDKRWTAKNNPYDVTVGQWVYDGLNTGTGKTDELRGLSLPELDG